MRLPNILTELESVEIVQKSSRYEVTFLDGSKGSCSAKLAEAIANETGEGVKDVVPIIVRVQIAGDFYDYNKDSFTRFSEKLLEKKLTEIINVYGTELTYTILEQLKYFELYEILHSLKPVETILEFV